jgi:hypothetical protein
MELYDMELAEAAKRIVNSGRTEDDFAFNRSFLPPDPDGGGMFTVRYQIEIANKKSSKSLMAVGGIGLDWVGYFEEALTEGYFDA